MSRTLLLVASLWLMGGCAVDEDILAVADQAVISSNGINPNGINPNGINPNGINPNGINPNGINPNGINPNGVMLNGINPNGINPNGINPNGTPIGVSGTGPPLTGPDIVGSTWTGNLSDGHTVAVRIDAALQGTGANTDMWSYRMSVSADGTWRPLCLDAAGNAGFADSVSGTWNLAQGVLGGGSYHPLDAQFTIACRGSAIAKCMELGYKPWTGHVRQLASCVRALRADYCGDGTPYTVNGTLVNIFDGVGLQFDTADWVPEAEWTPDGATCVSKKKNARFWQVAGARPSCYPHALKPENFCGTGFGGDTAIVTELAPQ